MHELIINAIREGGYLGIFVLMALENIIPPIPSEIIMGVGGVLVHRGQMSFWPLLLIGTLGSGAGNYVWYWIGNAWGYRRLKPFIARWGRWLTLEWHDVEEASRIFRKYGPLIVFVLRFSPFMRTMISLPAGLSHMPKGKFLVFTLLGSAIWNTLLIIGGTWLAKWLEQSQAVLGWGLGGLIAAALAWYIWRVFTWKPRAQPTEESSHG